MITRNFNNKITLRIITYIILLVFIHFPLAKDKVISPSVYLGELNQGQIKKGEYTISENIIKATEDCDCLVLKKTKNKLEYKFDTSKYKGRITRLIYIRTKYNIYQLKLIADIIPKENK